MATHFSVLSWRRGSDRGAWWAAVYGVAQSWTRLKWLSSSSRAQLSFLGFLEARWGLWLSSCRLTVNRKQHLIHVLLPEFLPLVRMRLASLEAGGQRRLSPIYKIDSQWEFGVWLRKLKQGLCINLEGWDGEGVPKGRGYVYTYGWFILRFDRKQQNSVKQLFFNKKKKKKAES